MTKGLPVRAILMPLALATMLAPVAAQAIERPLAPAAAEAPAPYVIGPNDVVEVSVLGRPDFTTRDRVSASGVIQLPFIGTVVIGGKTIEQSDAMLSKTLDQRGLFSHPIVKIDVVSYASHYVVVLGDVVSPGLVSIDRPYKLSEIVARAGGVKQGGADYVILRPQNGQERRISMQALATGGDEDDPVVAAGDKIYVPDAEMFYVTGQVKAPGAFPLTSGMTVRMAIGRGGGLSDAGSIKRIDLIRAGKRLQHVDPDSPVAPGDVITAKEGLF